MVTGEPHVRRSVQGALQIPAMGRASVILSVEAVLASLVSTPLKTARRVMKTGLEQTAQLPQQIKVSM